MLQFVTGELHDSGDLGGYINQFFSKFLKLARILALAMSQINSVRIEPRHKLTNLKF